MKRIAAMILALVMSLSLAACSANDAPSKEEQGKNEPAQTEQKNTFGLNETAVFKDLKFTATTLEESKGEQFFEPESGNVFVGIQFTIENISDEEQSVSSVLLFEAYADDVKCSYSLSAAMAFDGTLDGSLAPGKKLVGYYAVEVPEG